MSRRTRKTLAIYAVLVGLPLLGLAAILRAGGRLHAPPPVTGEWRIEGAAVAAGTDTAVQALAISQSGVYLDVALGSLSLRGRFVGDSMVAERRGRSVRADGACFRDAGVRVRMRVDGEVRPRRMAGVLESDGRGCAPVAFTAVRAVPARRRR
ncbi:MAG TPA: hypothetical protein VEX86_06095 [Longimicrobium sp.]|nr:hypothetical protein [Longimicrobium sp.]